MSKKSNKNSSMKFSQHDYISGQAVCEDENFTKETRNKPLRLSANRVRDKNNPKGWYTRFTKIEPASNIHRPMEPIFNTAFNRNGTTGVPKFVDLDVKWMYFAESFMMDQVIYQALQKIRLALKTNLTYGDDDVKHCITNGVALAIAGKMIERDVHWNLFDGSNDFNWAEMYKLRAQTTGTYGIIPLYPDNKLLTENLAYTSSVYNEMVSLFNSVIQLPKYVAEFVSHYFGSLFTLDKDGFNDQYLRIHMHDIDWYDYDNNAYSTIDLSSLTLDDYLMLLKVYSKKSAVILSDLKKCLGVSKVLLTRYETYAYTFVFDKTLLQALINGYTSGSLVSGGYVRMDKIPDVEDNLTQFLFMGGLQDLTAGGGDEPSKAQVGAITILDMVVKVNSDENIYWPASLDQISNFQQTENADFIKDEPFGLAIVTDIQSDATVEVSVNSNDSSYIAPTPTYPDVEQPITARSSWSYSFGFTAGKFPNNDVGRNWNTAESNCTARALRFLGCIETKTGTNVDAYFIFARASIAKGDLAGAGTVKVAYDKIVWALIQNIPSIKVSRITEDIVNCGDYRFFRDYTSSTRSSAQMMEYLFSTYISNYTPGTLSTGAADANLYPGIEICWAEFKGTTFNFSVYHRNVSSQVRPLIWEYSDNDTRSFGINGNSNMAPAGLGSLRSLTSEVQFTNTAISTGTTAGFESLAAYVCQVVDYHIPVAYKSVHSIVVSQNGVAVAERRYACRSVLLKEDYIPYHYNVLDLIPVLYEMFASLFAIDGIAKDRSVINK